MDEEYQFLPTFKKQIYQGKNFHTKNSVFEIEYTFFNQRNEIYMWKKTINFCHLLKNVSPQKFTCQKVSAFEIDYTFFNQRNKKEEDYQFLPPFKKQFIQINGSKCMEK